MSPPPLLGLQVPRGMPSSSVGTWDPKSGPRASTFTTATQLDTLTASVFSLLHASCFPPLPEGLAVLFFSINLCWAVTKNKFSLKEIIFLKNKLDANRTIIIVFK